MFPMNRICVIALPSSDGIRSALFCMASLGEKASSQITKVRESGSVKSWTDSALTCGIPPLDTQLISDTSARDTDQGRRLFSPSWDGGLNQPSSTRWLASQRILIGSSRRRLRQSSAAGFGLRLMLTGLTFLLPRSRLMILSTIRLGGSISFPGQWRARKHSRANTTQDGGCSLASRKQARFQARSFALLAAQ